MLRCGAIGTMRMLRSSGGKIGPPVASAYAVEPVGVEMIKASALYVVAQCWSM